MSEDKYNNSGSVTKRLQKELTDLMMTKVDGISAFPDGENIFKWVATIVGPVATLYAGQTYRLSLEFSSMYPFEPPCIRFITPCFHPNVDAESGSICLDILKNKWSALLQVSSVLLSIQSLLGEPNIESPLNDEAAKLWENKTEYHLALVEFYEKNKTVSLR